MFRILSIIFGVFALGCFGYAIRGMITGNMDARAGTRWRIIGLAAFATCVVLNVIAKS